MNYHERIPVKTECVDMSGQTVKIDTKGMEATIAAVNGSVYLKAAENVSNSEAFILKEGDSIVLNGHFYINGDNADVRILYCKII